MAEIQLDADTHIREMDDNSSTAKQGNSQKNTATPSTSKNPRSVVVKISTDKLTPKSDEKKQSVSKSKNSASSSSTSNSTTTVSSQKKKELLKKAQLAKEKLNKEKEKTSAKQSTASNPEKVKDTPSVPEPMPVPENYNIPRVSQAEPSDPRSKSPSSRSRDEVRKSPRRSRSPRGSARREDRGSSRGPRSRSPRRSTSRSTSRRRSRSPYYRRRRSPSRSRSREFRPYFSPRRRSPSPYFRRRSPPPRVYRPREQSFSRSPLRYGPPRWQRGDDRFSGPRDDGFTRPPPRSDFDAWDRGVPNQPPSFPPQYPRGQPEFQGFSDHSEQWGMTAIPPPTQTRSQNNPVQRDVVPNTSAQRDAVPTTSSQLLAIPSEMLPSSSQQSIIDSLKEEIKGLSKTMLSITAQMGNSTKGSSDVVPSPEVSSQRDSSNSRLSDTTTVQPITTPSTEIVATVSGISSRPTTKTVSSAHQEVDEMEVSSESGGESSEEESSSEDSGDESEPDSMVKTPEGFLDWITLNRLIVEKFGDQIAPEESSTPVARISNLGGLSEKKETERIRLPMYSAVRTEFLNLARDIKNPPLKARARKDTRPLGRGVFPEAQKGLPIQALSEDLRFNQPAQIDAGIERLLPPKKSSYNIQGRFSDENLRKMERDLRVNMSCLSYSLWAMDFATTSLLELGEKLEKKEEKDAMLACVSACKHSMSFLTSVVDRSATAMVTTILARRDSYLAQMDPLLQEEDQILLRTSSFVDTSLFAGSIGDLIPKLESLRRDSQSRESVDVLTSLAKKGVESNAKKTNSGSGYSKKKSSKKHSKKKGSKKNANASSTVTTTTTEQASGGIQRTFRNKGKKSSKK